ncbi:MAG: ATP-binding cassette domain-containing protein [Deltaproteobacteria bacterium]|nr:ATP-binding cassette domain-containing protein [Deltaproteobacteria bacterium]
MEKEIIRVETLSKHFGAIKAVDQITFSVKEGEIFGFLGPNGAGKTTTIRMLVGLLRPDSGSAVVNGHDVIREPVRAKESVGVVPESSNLYGELSAVENLVYMAQLYGVPRGQWQPRAEELLKEFNLLDRKGGKFQGFSRGMKRRLTIAAALVHRPQVLFLDEPTTGLDVMSARGLRSAIRGLKAKGVTVFLTTHLIQEAEDLCDRVAIIVKGKIRIIDAPGGLQEMVKETEVLEIQPRPVSPSLPKMFEGLPGVEKAALVEDKIRLYGESIHNSICQILNRLEANGIKVVSIKSLVPTLEDAFVKMTGVDAEIMRVDKPMKMGGMG